MKPIQLLLAAMAVFTLSMSHPSVAAAAAGKAFKSAPAGEIQKAPKAPGAFRRGAFRVAKVAAYPLLGAAAFTVAAGGTPYGAGLAIGALIGAGAAVVHKGAMKAIDWRANRRAAKAAFATKSLK